MFIFCCIKNKSNDDKIKNDQKGSKGDMKEIVKIEAKIRQEGHLRSGEGGKKLKKGSKIAKNLHPEKRRITLFNL